MSVSVTVRLPDILAAKLVSRCLIRKARKTDVLVEAIERGWDDAPAISGGETFGLRVNTDAGLIPDCTLKSSIAGSIPATPKTPGHHPRCGCPLCRPK